MCSAAHIFVLITCGGWRHSKGWCVCVCVRACVRARVQKHVARQRGRSSVTLLQQLEKQPVQGQCKRLLCDVCVCVCPVVGFKPAGTSLRDMHVQVYRTESGRDAAVMFSVHHWLLGWPGTLGGQQKHFVVSGPCCRTWDSSLSAPTAESSFCLV